MKSTVDDRTKLQQRELHASCVTPPTEALPRGRCPWNFARRSKDG